MSASASPFDRAPPARQRAVGRVSLEVAALGGRTRPLRIQESGSLRVRLPKGVGAGLDAVLVNTAGGIACGDRFSLGIDVQAGAAVTVATPAAERIYRSDGPRAELSVDLTLAAGARMEWLPQETILFDQARLARRLHATIAEDARLTLLEAVVFGRTARAEQVAQGLFEDRWRIKRGSRLVYADTLRLDGSIAELLKKPSVGNGSRALATLIHVSPDAEARLDAVRECLSPRPGVEAAASAWNGLLAVRFCAANIEALRASLVPFLLAFRGEPLPRVWLS